MLINDANLSALKNTLDSCEFRVRGRKPREYVFHVVTGFAFWPFYRLHMCERKTFTLMGFVVFVVPIWEYCT